MSVTDQLLSWLARAHAGAVWRRTCRAAADAPQAQESTLLAKLRRNADSDYGRRFGFAHLRGYADFARAVPIQRYEDLLPYVERVKAGELSAMFGGRQRVLMFAITSGTTDRPKYVPVTDSFLREYRRGWNAFGIKALNDHPHAFLRQIVQVSAPVDDHMTDSGVPCGSISGIMAATQKRLVRKYYAVPHVVSRIADAHARYYATMRFALPADPGFLITASPATQLSLARTGDAYAAELIRDIYDGTLDDALDIPAGVRAALAGRLRSIPDEARRLERVVERTGRLLPKDCWQLDFLANWTGGTMGLYLRDFSEYFGKVPVRDIGLLASEGRMSIPFDDGTAAGLLDVANNFFEFVPAAEYESMSPTVLRCHELSVGEEYYILLTTSAGFYRYDIGDVVRVTGFVGPTPLIEFLHKGAHVCSLAGEKISERQVVLAFEQACAALAVGTHLFVLAPQWGQPPYYRLYHEDRPDLCGDRLAPAVDERLAAVNVEYASKRKSARLGAIVASALSPEALHSLDRLAGPARAADEQYKHRYLLTKLGQDASLSTTPPPLSNATPR